MVKPFNYVFISHIICTPLIIIYLISKEFLLNAKIKEDIVV